MRKFEEIMKIIALVFVNAVLIIGLLAVTGCGEDSPTPVAKYHQGQIVHMVIDDRPVMITRVWWTRYRGISYTIRATAKMESTAFLGGEVDVSPYSELDVNEFELKD